MCSNRIIGDTEYRFAAEYQQRDAYSRKTLVQQKPQEVYIHTRIHVIVIIQLGKSVLPDLCARILGCAAYDVFYNVAAYVFFTAVC